MVLDLVPVWVSYMKEFTPTFFLVIFETVFISFYCILAKRRKFSSKSVVFTEAQKQLMICHLPQVLRLHLKRFRSVVFQLSTTSGAGGVTGSFLLVRMLQDLE
jgi:hypothetical protein